MVITPKASTSICLALVAYSTRMDFTRYCHHYTILWCIASSIGGEGVVYYAIVVQQYCNSVGNAGGLRVNLGLTLHPIQELTLTRVFNIEGRDNQSRSSFWFLNWRATVQQRRQARCKRRIVNIHYNIYIYTCVYIHIYIYMYIINVCIHIHNIRYM